MSSDLEFKQQVYQSLLENPGWRKTLEEAFIAEEKQRAEAEAGNYTYLGWEWYEVHTPPATLNRMVTAHILDIGHKGRTSTYYLLRRPDVLKEVLDSITESTSVVTGEGPIPQDLFSNIVGHDNIKTIVRYAIESPRPTHLLMTGVPASAKTLFLLELNRLPNAYYALGPTLSEAGLADMLFIYEPKFLLIDEIERLGGQNLGVLNSLMATGWVLETKFHKTRRTHLDTKVLAAGIKTQRLPSDLLSRFVKLYFEPYSQQEFIEVTVGVLEREDVSKDDAAYIGKEIWETYGTDADVRQCVYVARLAVANGASSQRIKEVLRILKRQEHNRIFHI